MNIVHTGNRFQVYGDDVKTYKELPIGTYTIGFHPQMGIWLSVHNNLQIGEEKVYGSHSHKVEKVFNSFDKSERNFGIILSGKKGIGKSLFCKNDRGCRDQARNASDCSRFSYPRNQ